MEAILKLPKLKRRRVWLGYYFNHYNAIVIYHTKPVMNAEGVYDTFDNQKKIAGCATLEDFRCWFPKCDISPIIDKKTGYVRDMETEVLLEVYMTAFWGENKRLTNIDFTLDGY